MVTQSRTDIFIESELNKVKIIGMLQNRPLTRNELCSVLNITKMQMHNLLKKLVEQSYLKIADAHAFCSVAKRSMCTFTTTGRMYIGKDLTEIKARADANKEKRELRKAQGPCFTDNEDHLPKSERTNPTVVKVDNNTTIYYNSRRPQSDFTMKKEKKSRRNSSVAMGSSMSMFRNW
jgi:hypothetical protein